MSEIPQFNFPAFDAAATHLRQLGWDIVSPAELDSEEVRAQALASPDGKSVVRENDTAQTWGDFLARDVKIVADTVKAVILLPDWDKSRGAVLEVTVGLLCGHSFYLYDKLDGPRKIERAYVKYLLQGSPKL